MSDSEEDDYYGPALPPHLLQQKDNSANDKPPQVIGPVVPNTSDGGLPSIGPMLPPGFKLPKDADQPSSSSLNNDHQNSTHKQAHQSPDHDSDSDEDVIGPLPPDHPKALARAAAYKSNSSDTSNKPSKKLQREEWMLIPPTNKPVTELGLGPRKFLQRAPAQPVPDDDEEVDSDEEFERRTRAELDRKIIDEYDKKMEAMIDTSGKRKSESLLEIHQKEMKKAKSEKAEDTKRKPFDRSTDLAVAGLSREDAKKYVEKSRELGGRFQKGRQKFL